MYRFVETAGFHVPRRVARQAFSHPLRAVGCASLAALGLLISTSSLQNVVANGDTRAIYFQHTHRDDAITVTFKRNGRYDEEALKKLNYFLRDWRNDDQTRMDPQLFDILWEVTRELGTEEPVRIVSSYRSPATNAMLRRRSRGVAQFSQHMLGKAIDFNINGAPVERLREIAMRLQRGGVGFYPGSFVHVDVGSVRHWPRMTHDQLARLFPNGRTVHVPSDGQPLPGYALALADIEKRGTSMPSGMSLASARRSGAVDDEERTERVASAAKPKKGNIFARLFGFSTDDEEDEDQPAGATTVAKIPEEALPARVPIPQARPQIQLASRDANKGGGFALASASSTPFDLNARSAPRPPAPIADEASASRTETTASINSWLKDTEGAHRSRAGRPRARLCGRRRSRRRTLIGGRARGIAARQRRDHANREDPAEGRPALQRSLAARHHARIERALRDERFRLRQARCASGAHHDDQAGVEPDDGVRRQSL
ncbi:MAG: DUF882 domain-containing protein [Alphaproteobacteria bacterium]